MAPLQSEDQQQEHQHHHQREHHHHLHTRSHPHSFPHSSHHSHHHHHLVAPSSPRTLSPATEQLHHHHHHHQRQHHHHHHHHSHTTTTTTSPAPSSSPQLHQSSGRTESPAFGMNKSSNTAAAGSAAPASPSYSSSTGPAQQQQQQQVISRTGRGGPAPSSLANPGGPAAPPPAAAAGRSAINGTNGQQHHPSTSSAHTNGKATSSPHHLHSHHPSASSSSSVRPPGAPTGVAGFGGPITVAEALSNVNTDRALGPLPPHSSSSAVPPPWSSSATANTAPPLSAGHHMHSNPSTAAVVPGPSSNINATIHASAAANTSLTGLASGPNMPGGVNGAPVASTANTPSDPHNLPIRWVTEHGNYLNHEAARELGGKEGFNILERKKNLPQLLQKLESETESCYSEIGSIAWNLGDYAKAKKHFEIALKRNPFCLASLNGLARYYHEIAANGGGAGSSNISASTERGGGGIPGMSNNNINGSSTNGITSNNGAVAAGGANTSITSIEESYNKVVDYASRSLSIDETGNEGEIWSLIGHSFLQLGQMSRAYSCYQQAIAKAIKKDDPKLWYGIGILYDRYGSVEHAEEAFASVLKLDPNFHKREEVFFRLGIIYKLQGKADASLECFHYILARPPEPLKAVDVWYQIGHAHELKRDLTLAKDAYERVLSTTPDHSKVLQHLGGIYLRERTPFHNPQKCIDYISQSLEHDSTDPFSWYLLGRAFMQQSNYGKAYEAYQQAVYRDGKNPAYWCSIGVLYFNINQFHDALDAYTRAVRIHPFIPEIWQNLGILYESCHDQLADATDAYQRASQLDPGNIELERRLKEVRNALRNGTEITSAPPPPQDIMPDSKSWHSVHMDVSGAKPVYLDSKSISQQASPAPEPPLGLGPGGVGPASVMPMHAREGALLRGSPPLANGGPPPGYGGAGGGMGIHELQTNGRRRSSFSRPDSSHGAHGHGAPPPPGAYLGQYPEEAMRGRHGPAGAPTGHPLASQHALTMAGRPSAHSLAGPAHEPDPRDGPISHRGGPAGSRIPPPSSTLGRGPPPPTFPGDRHSPHSMHDPTFRHTAISPTNSPRTRAAEYEYQLRAAAAAERHGDPLYERERQMREAEREREEQSRAGSRAGPPQHPQQREQQQHREQQQRRHPGPSAGPGGPSHSPTDQRTPSAFSQRDYPAPGSRRPGSPLQGGPPPPPGSRYAEERGAPGPGRTASSRPIPPGYPYGYYQDGPHAYADPRRDPRYNNDPRYEYEAAERERQVRRGGHPPSAMEEEERRRRSEMDKQAPSPAGIRTGRRDHSPVDILDGRERELRRGIPLPGQGDHGPGLPSMRLVAPRGQGGHYGSHPEQGQRSAGGPQPDQKGTAMDRRRQHGRHPDMPPEAHLSNRQPEQTFDDETDMANALIGLAGIASSADVASSMGGGGPPSSYRAGEKRPGSPSHDEDARFKKARGQDDMSL